MRHREPEGDKTTTVITVDHGRGNTPGDWGSHGSRVERSRYVWMAFVSRDSTLQGEWSQAPTIYSNQIAATLCRALGFDYREQNRGAGAPIERLFENRWTADRRLKTDDGRPKTEDRRLKTDD
jgi:hypothetical protein